MNDESEETSEESCPSSNRSKCRLCPASILTKFRSSKNDSGALVASHVRTHLKVKQFICSKCGFNSGFDQVKKHIDSHHQGESHIIDTMDNDLLDKYYKTALECFPQLEKAIAKWYKKKSSDLRKNQATTQNPANHNKKRRRPRKLPVNVPVNVRNKKSQVSRASVGIGGDNLSQASLSIEHSAAPFNYSQSTLRVPGDFSFLETASREEMSEKDNDQDEDVYDAYDAYADINEDIITNQEIPEVSTENHDQNIIPEPDLSEYRYLGPLFTNGVVKSEFESEYPEPLLLPRGSVSGSSTNPEVPPEDYTKIIERQFLEEVLKNKEEIARRDELIVALQLKLQDAEKKLPRKELQNSHELKLALEEKEEECRKWQEKFEVANKSQIQLRLLVGEFFEKFQLEKEKNRRLESALKK